MSTIADFSKHKKKRQKYRRDCEKCGGYGYVKKYYTPPGQFTEKPRYVICDCMKTRGVNPDPKEE